MFRGSLPNANISWPAYFPLFIALSLFLGVVYSWKLGTVNLFATISSPANSLVRSQLWLGASKWMEKRSNSEISEGEGGRDEKGGKGANPMVIIFGRGWRGAEGRRGVAKAKQLFPFLEHRGAKSKFCTDLTFVPGSWNVSKKNLGPFICKKRLRKLYYIISESSQPDQPIDDSSRAKYRKFMWRAVYGAKGN